MNCHVCHRPLLRAYALIKGQPVGPKCGAGLKKGRRKGRVEVVRETDSRQLDWIGAMA